MSQEPYPYALVVRWPVGGIRTHLKYSRELLASDAAQFKPVYVSYDDIDTALAVSSLAIAPQDNRSTGVHSLSKMFFRVLQVCANRRIRLIHSQGFISSILSTPASLLFGKRHVVSVHDVITDEVIASTRGFSRGILGLCLRLSFAVHAVGEDCARSIRRLPFMKKAKNIVIIRNGIDIRRFSNTSAVDLRSIAGADPATQLIGFFGRFHPQKGFRDLIDAVGLLKTEHPELSLKVVAVGDAGTLEEDKAYIASKGLQECFYFHSQVENPASLMVSCDMIAMPSHWEAYSLLAAEVLTLGVPLIASDCIGLAEVTRDTPARSFQARNPRALAEALIAEAKAPTKGKARTFMSEARNRFDFTQNAQRINRLLYIAHTCQPLNTL